MSHFSHQEIDGDEVFAVYTTGQKQLPSKEPVVLDVVPTELLNEPGADTLG